MARNSRGYPYIYRKQTEVQGMTSNRAEEISPVTNNTRRSISKRLLVLMPSENSAITDIQKQLEASFH